MEGGCYSPRSRKAARAAATDGNRSKTCEKPVMLKTSSTWGSIPISISVPWCAFSSRRIINNERNPLLLRKLHFVEIEQDRPCAGCHRRCYRLERNRCATGIQAPLDDEELLGGDRRFGEAFAEGELVAVRIETIQHLVHQLIHQINPESARLAFLEGRVNVRCWHRCRLEAGTPIAEHNGQHPGVDVPGNVHGPARLLAVCMLDDVGGSFVDGELDMPRLTLGHFALVRRFVHERADVRE